MITLKELRIKNFLSHDDTAVEFKDGQRLLIEGKSGSGKSAILDAIIFCLYGKGRVDGRSLVKQGEKKATVELHIQDGDHVYVIIRSVNGEGKNVLSIAEATSEMTFEPIPVSGLKNLQEWIEKELIHASYQLFINSVAYPQDNAETFVKQTASKRKELLMEMAPVEDFSLYLERAKGQFQLTEEMLQRLNGELRALEIQTFSEETLIGEEKNASEALLLLESELKSAQEKRSVVVGKISELENLEAHAKSLEKDASEALLATQKTELEVSSVESKLHTLQGLQKPSEDRTELTNTLIGIDQSLRAFYELQGNYRMRRYELDTMIQHKPAELPYAEEITNINRQLIEAMKSVKSLCDLGENCKNHQSSIRMKTAFWEEQLQDRSQRLAEQNKVLAFYVEKVGYLSKALPKEPDLEELKRLTDLRDRTAKMLNALAEYEKSQAEISGIVATLKEKQNALTEKKGLYEDLMLKLSSVRQNLGLHAPAEERKVLNDLDKSIELLRSKHRTSVGLLSSLKTALEYVRKNVARQREISKELATLAARRDLLQLMKDAFGSKGIQTLVVDILIPKLENSINGILNQLSDFRVSLETVRSNTAGDGQVEGLFINVVDPQGHQLEFASYSGGEKLKIVVAISEALASLQRVGFRLLDELFVGLDEASTEGFLAVLNKIQNRFSQVVCISHLREIKDAFNDRIEIVKLNGGSQIA